MKKKENEILTIDGISKSFGPTKALINIKLKIFRGEARGLIGENGSGKSTLASIISGILKPDNGKMYLNYEEYKPHNILAARKSGVSIIVQEKGTIDNLTVAENIFIGKEDSFSKWGNVHKKEMINESKRILEEIGASYINPSDSINDLSFEDRKLIEVAIAKHDQPDILILDETTTALTQKGRDRIYELIDNMKKSGKTVLFISHDLTELESVCDRITVLRDGEIVKTLSKEEVNAKVMRQLMIGRKLQEHYYRNDFTPSSNSEVVLSVDKVFLDNKLNDISFNLHRGEILGIGGLTDCGMHELGKVMFGIIKPDSGLVRILPKNKIIKKAEDAINNNIGYVPKDRAKEALMQTASIRDNIVLLSLDKLKKGQFITSKSEKLLAKKMADSLRIKMLSINQLCMYLSGGNKQKVSIAKWLANDSQILIMDCPTRGIDIGVKAAIYELMNDIKKAGKSILMISEELPELIGMADRILIFKNGQISGSFLRSEDLSEASIIKKMI